MSLTGAYEKDGERVVGGSRRSDGSVRPIAKVRPGYIAKEDAPKYKPRAARERDAKLGIATAESPVTSAKAETDDGDSKSAIKARIQAMKAEFARKKAEKENEKEKEADKGELSDLTASLDSLDIKRDLRPGSKREDEVRAVGLKSRHMAREDSQTRKVSSGDKANDNERPSAIATEKPSNVTERPSTNVPDKSSTSQAKTSKTPLKSRHAKPTESVNESKINPQTGYIPPHKRK
ncbi:hypothetical protein CJU89_6951 [Yarrowia sp. B02]|nr:hypothetical protein CJU89_6951 [Yarrowia sp. B02]